VPVSRSRLRAGVVGAGFIGLLHARALMEHDGVEVVGICGRTAPKTEALAARCGTDAYLSVAELLERAQPDLVTVGTGNDEHVEPTIQALEAGVHVFVEKPLAFRVEQARALVEAAERYGVRLGVNFNHRFSEPYRRALAFRDEGALGELAYVDMKFAGDLYKDLNNPYCMLVETQGHAFDLMRLFGGEIAEVSAFLSDPRGIGVYTSAAASVRFENGAVGSLIGSWDSSYAHPAAQVLEASGTRGRLEVENVVDAVRLYRHDDAAFVQWRPGIFDTAARDFWRTIDVHLGRFVDAVAAGHPPPVTGEDGVRALKLTYAAIRSFEEGRPIQP
jgi:predicted dehydrogenase